MLIQLAWILQSLHQKQKHNRNTTLRHMGCCCKSLKLTRLHKSRPKQEMFAVINVIGTFHCYLAGREFKWTFRPLQGLTHTERSASRPMSLYNNPKNANTAFPEVSEVFRFKTQIEGDDLLTGFIITETNSES